MKKFTIFLILILLSQLSFSIDFNKKVNIINDSTEINSPNFQENVLAKSVIPNNEEKKESPGRIPSFWWSFVLSLVGSYTIYGIGAGPLSVLVVYFASKRDKTEVRKSIWGWILGTITGLGLWYFIKIFLRS